MGRLSAVLLALLLGGVSALALTSCGGGNANLLPGTTASQIESNLDQVKQLTAEGECIGAENAVAEVAAEVEGLREVDLKLKAALQEGTAKLSEVVSECEETGEEAEPSLEPDVGAEELKEKKPKKEKPEKKVKEPAEQKEEATEPEEGPELPPQSNGKGEENGKGGPPEAPEAEEAPSSGGVGPGVGVEE